MKNVSHSALELWAGEKDKRILANDLTDYGNSLIAAGFIYYNS